MELDQDYPPLSALNDYLFCPRRCALHRLEGVWIENMHTTGGSLDHRRVHQARDAEEGGSRTVRGLRLVSHSLRVVGVADMVEFHRADEESPETPYLVEYKRGKRRRWDNNEVQLCAQAICLEEMLGVTIPRGAIYHVKSKRRCEVEFDSILREQTAKTATRLHELLATSTTPPPILHRKCVQCSLHDICLPELIAAPKSYERAAATLFQIHED